MAAHYGKMLGQMAQSVKAVTDAAQQREACLLAELEALRSQQPPAGAQASAGPSLGTSIAASAHAVAAIAAAAAAVAEVAASPVPAIPSPARNPAMASIHCYAGDAEACIALLKRTADTGTQPIGVNFD